MSAAQLLYDLAIRSYGLAVRVAALFNRKAAKWAAGRSGLLETVERETTASSEETLWVHCASLGEFEMVRPILEEVRQIQSRTRIVLTFFSPSGYEIRKKTPLADLVFYLPLDTPSNAARFVQAIRPSTVVFVKYDLWYHHLKEAKMQGAKLLLISAVFRPSQPYFRAYGAIGRKALRLFDRIFLVDAESEKLLRGVGVTDAVVCGDTRYDRVMKIAASADHNGIIEKFKGNSNLIVCGSTWKEDENVLAASIGTVENTKWIIAPHEVEEKNIRRVQELFPGSVRYSEPLEAEAQVLIIDSIGLLSTIYRYADVAYIGGAFRTGLHNLLEAAAYGIPTVFGPDTSRFPDADEMADEGLAFRIRNAQELDRVLRNLLSTDRNELSKQIKSFMGQRTGATRTILQFMAEC